MRIFSRLALPSTAGIGVGLLFLIAPAASALDFTFSFTDNSGFNPTGSVQGVATGLPDGLDDFGNPIDEVGAATSVQVTAVTSAGGSFGLGNYTPFATVNSFTVNNGVVTTALFRASGVTSFAGCSASLGCTLYLDSGANTIEPGTDAGLDNGRAAPDITSVDPPGTLNFVPFEFSPVWGLLLLGGLWGANHFYRKWAVRQSAESLEKALASEAVEREASEAIR